MISTKFSTTRRRRLLFVFDIKATRNEESEGFTWEIKDFQYKDWEECKDVEERKVKIKKSTEVLEWALYDSVSNPCTVLVLIC
jgi:protein tyrosine phosphatase